MDTVTELQWLMFVLQTSDPLFPTGAYAHSLGLEEIVRLGVVRDAKTLQSFLSEQIVPALTRLELPYLRFARDAAMSGSVEDLCAIDREIDAWKMVREIREASMQLGTRRLRMLLQISSNDLMAEFEARKPCGHHLTVYGLQMMRVPLDVALGTYFYQTLAGFCGAALKLIRIGQESCQRILCDCLREAPAAVDRSQRIDREEAGWFNPLLEIASMRHERADERLFIS